MKAFWLAITAALIWGVVAFIEKVGLSGKGVDPSEAVIVRTLGCFFGAIVLFIILYFMNSGNIATFKNPDWKSIAIILVAGMFGSVFGQVFFYQALQLGNASVVTPVAASYPLITFILCILFLGEPLTISKAAGVVCVITGIVLLK